MPARSAFQYALLRVVPSLERGEFVNAGVVVFCRQLRFLEARVALDEGRLLALAPGIAIVATVLAVNALGDAVRDALDPRAPVVLEREPLAGATAPPVPPVPGRSPGGLGS